MIYLLFFLFIFVLPKIWLNSALKRNDEILESMPFTGLEFGLKKINSFDFKRAIRMEMGKIITNTEKLYFINFLRFFIIKAKIELIFRMKSKKLSRKEIHYSQTEVNIEGNLIGLCSQYRATQR